MNNTILPTKEEELQIAEINKLLNLIRKNCHLLYKHYYINSEITMKRNTWEWFFVRRKSIDDIPYRIKLYELSKIISFDDLKFKLEEILLRLI